MPRGVPLTPPQLARAAELYETSGNYSAVARALGVDESAVRRALTRRAEPDRAALHARACAQGVRRARRSLARGVALVDTLLDAARTDGAGLEAKDVAALLNAQSKAASVLLDVDAHRDRRRQAALTRAKTRAEIEQLRLRNRGDLPPEKHAIELQWPDDPEPPDDDGDDHGGAAPAAAPAPG